jgi:hypothetical protein
VTIVSKPASPEYRDNFDTTFSPDEVGVVYHDRIPDEYQVPLTVRDEERAPVKPLVKVTEWTGYSDDCTEGDWMPEGWSVMATGRFRFTVEFWPEDAGK